MRATALTDEERGQLGDVLANAEELDRALRVDRES